MLLELFGLGVREPIYCDFQRYNPCGKDPNFNRTARKKRNNIAIASRRRNRKK